MDRGRTRLAGFVVVSLLAVGCSGPSNQSGKTPSESVTPTTARSSPTESAWRITDARVDRFPSRLRFQRSNLPARFPRDDAVLPDLLSDPPGRAVVAYHPRESFDDRGGWVTERVFFHGVDGAWRSLELVDLGLPESTHPGVDTYGAGELSPNGRWWATHTNAGVLIMDLRSTRWDVVHLPGKYTNYLGWRPDGSGLVVDRFTFRSTYRTFSVKLANRSVAEADYRLPLDGFADDGSVVTFERERGQTVRVRWNGDDVRRKVVPIPFRVVRDADGGAIGSDLTMFFGRLHGFLVVRSDTMRPVARLDFDRRVSQPAWPRDWLDDRTFLFYEGRYGLLTWRSDTGQVRLLTRVTPRVRPRTWWTASVALDLVR